MWGSFETKYWITDESPKMELYGFESMTVNPKHLATRIPAETEIDEDGNLIILKPPTRIDHVGGTILPGHYGIHWAVSLDLPGILEETPEGCRMWAEYRIRPFSKLRERIKRVFVDEDGNNISPKRKYKPGKSIFFVSERLAGMLEQPGVDLTPQLDALEADVTRLKKSLQDMEHYGVPRREEPKIIEEKKEVALT